MGVVENNPQPHGPSLAYLIFLYNNQKTHDLQTCMTLLTEAWAEECEVGLHATDIRDVNGRK